MSLIKDAKNALTNPHSQIHWVKLIVALAALVALSFALAAVLGILKDRLNIDLYRYPWLAYLSVFAISLLANLTIIAPVPFAIAVMATAAQHFNPVFVALFGAAGGTLGELSGYFAGKFGRKIAIPEGITSNQRVTLLIKKYGFWGIAFIAFQPIIPFDVGGVVAGAGKMPLPKFLPALFLGKFPKYFILVQASLGVIDFLPPWITHNFT
jgi:membrane protein YqaA with SNARE-associated domain